MTQPNGQRTRPARGGKTTRDEQHLPMATLPPAVPHVYQALRYVMQAVGAVGKGDFNEQQRFKFRGVETVVNALSPHMIEAGLTALPEVINRSYDQVRIGREGTLMGHAVVDVRYTFTSLVDGSTVAVVVVGEAMDVGDKAFSKAQSVAWRVALIQAFALATGDVDPDHSVYERTTDCDVPQQEQPRERPSRGRKDAQGGKPTPPSADQLSRWQGQIWDVGALGLYEIATEVLKAGAWNTSTPGKENYPMWQEVVDRVACLAMSSEITTRSQLADLRELAVKIKILNGQVSAAGSGPAPRLAEVLIEAEQNLAARTHQEAAATPHGQQAVAEATSSWDDDEAQMRNDAAYQEGDTPA